MGATLYDSGAYETLWFLDRTLTVTMKISFRTLTERSHSLSRINEYNGRADWPYLSAAPLNGSSHATVRFSF